ncbi:MAG: ABC transporter permease [Planctomycetes bacterium]|nr:ABC transporter permease [Planctomycetota bacterium]
MYRWFLALRYILGRPINLLGSIGVMVAVAALIAVGSVFAGFVQEARAHVRGNSPTLSYLDDTLHSDFRTVADVALADPAVKAIAPRIVWDALLYFDNQIERNEYSRIADRDLRTTNYFRVVGIDWKREQEVSDIRSWVDSVKGPLQTVADVDHPFEVDADRAPPRGDFEYGEAGILLGRSRTLGNVPSIGVGQRVKLASARLDHGDGLEAVTWPLVVSGVFSSGRRYRDIENQTAFVDIETLRRIFGEDPDDPDSREVISEASITLHDETSMDAVAARLNRAMLAKGLRGRVVTWEERNARFLTAVEIERNVMRIVLVILVIVASFLIFALLSVMVSQKTRDIGILAALGATRGGVLTIFLTNGIVISGIGILLGLLLGWQLVVRLDGINNWLRQRWGVGIFPTEIYGRDGIPSVLELSWFVQVSIVALAIAVLFSFIPALRAARFDPVRAFRYE